MEAETYDSLLSPGSGGETVAMPAPVSSSYVVKDPVDIVIDKKGLSGSKYTIYESGGAVLFSVKGTFNVFQTKRILVDASEKGLVCMKGEFASTYSKWSVYRGEDDRDGNLLFTMKKSSVFQSNPSLEIHLVGNDKSERPDFTVKGNFSERKFKIYYGSKVIAEADKKTNALSFLSGTGRYAVAIYPGVDQAFIASIVIIISLYTKYGWIDDWSFFRFVGKF